jgi:hypothetical protein
MERAMMTDNGLPGGVGLADAIETLRAELNEVLTNAPETGVGFRSGPVELTVQAAVTKDITARAGVK